MCPAAGRPEMTPDQPRTMVLDGPEVIRIAIRRAWIVILLAAVGVAAGAGYQKAKPKEYSAERQLLVTGQVLDPLLVNVTNGSQDPGRLVQTQVDLLTGSSVKEAAKMDLRHAPGRIQVGSGDDSNVLLVSVVGGTKKRASEGLDAYLKAYMRVVSRQELDQVNAALSALQDRIDGLDQQIAAADRKSTRETYLNQRIDVADNISQLRVAKTLGATLVDEVGDGTEVKSTALSLPISGALGGVIGAAVGILIATGLERRRRRRRSDI